MLCAFMVDMIASNLDDISVVSMQRCSLNLGKAKLCEKTTKLNDLKLDSKHGKIPNLSR